MSLFAPDRGATLMIVDIARLLRRRFETALANIDTGLTVAEARTLAFIWRNPGLRQAALAERMFVEPMTLVGYLDGLEKAGLIKRSVDPCDRRAKLITLTDAADPILQKIETAMRDVRADTLSSFPPKQQEELEAMLETIRANLLASLCAGHQE